jgi:WD40 repeat protein
MGEPSTIRTGVLQTNPFPGIRPFTSMEDKYFFGRDGAISDVLDALRSNRFVALVGATGSGKTSLIQSGIIPTLLLDEGQEWVPISIRPGVKPVESLIRGFQQVFPKKLSESDVESFLSSSQTLGGLINDKGLGSHNYYLVVDQFEDLFRNQIFNQKKNGRSPEAARFVDLLMNAVNDKKPGIYVMLSIRSDFLDACSLYRNLTEKMNKSKYLLPQMTREALSRAILGPIHQAGASVEPGFGEYLLDELEEVEVKLPVLQHAMMKTWDHWMKQGDPDKAITIGHYQSIGPIRDALGDHLEQAYKELNYSQQVVCEHIFKSITSKLKSQEGFRRPASVATVARIAQCSVKEVIGVLEVFRKPGRAFLEPRAGVKLSAESQIELAHESLIVLWKRLQDWVNEEAESIKMYLKLSEASALYQQGRTELWRPPELQAALNWKNSQNPTPAWGVQYNSAFERAMVFLTTSEEEYKWNEERKIIKQRRRLLMNRGIAILTGVLLVVLAIVFFGSKKDSNLTDQMDPAVNQSYSEVPEMEVSTSRPAQVVAQEPVVEELAVPETSLEDESTGTDNEFQTERENTPVTTRNRPSNSESSNVDANRTPASSRSTETNTARNRPASQTVSPSSNAAALARERDQRILALAKDVAVQSTEVSKNPDLQGLLAYQAYQMNTRYSGTYYEADIYNGLYLALKKLISPAYNIYPNLRSSVKDIQWLDRTGSILVASSDGSLKILSGNIAEKSTQINLTGTGLNNECLAISPDERTAAVGTNGGGLLFVELENRGDVIHQTTDQGNIVLFLQNLGNSGSFVSAGTDNRILKWEYSGFTSATLVSTAARPSALAASSDGSRVAYATRDGKVVELDANNPASAREVADFGRNHVRALSYSPGGQYLVAGLLDGTLRVLAGTARRSTATLRGPGARVTDIGYSSDGRFLAAASHDGNVYLWNTSNWGNPPMIFSENNGFVLAVCFNKNSSYFYSGSVDYPRLIGRPSEPAEMAKDFCSLIGRNLTEAEWETYFGTDLPYEKTCPGLN